MPIRTYVPSPPSRQARWPGLIASLGGEAAIQQAMTPSDGGPDRWEAGYEFAPLDCVTGGTPQAPCEAISFSPERPPNTVQVDPLIYWDAVECTTIGGDQGIADRARAKLNGSLSHQLEEQLLSGAVATANGLEQQYLAGVSSTQLNGGDPTPLPYALAWLQDTIAKCGEGARAMIHATPFTASLWLASGVVRRDGPLLLDAFDNIVVAGTAYDGRSPAGIVDATKATAWAYATTMVAVRLGTVEVVDYVNPTDNTRWSVAMRSGAFSWDGCCQLAIKVDHDAACNA